MKVTKKATAFQPVTITLETQAEVDIMARLTGQNCTVVDAMYSISLDERVAAKHFLGDLYSALGESK